MLVLVLYRYTIPNAFFICRHWYCIVLMRSFGPLWNCNCRTMVALYFISPHVDSCRYVNRQSRVVFSLHHTLRKLHRPLVNAMTSQLPMSNCCYCCLNHTLSASDSDRLVFILMIMWICVCIHIGIVDALMSHRSWQRSRFFSGR